MEKKMLNCYAIYDKKAMSFATPFFAINDEVAKRHASKRHKNDLPGAEHLHATKPNDTASP
jgi:hypothetical protein